MALDLPWWLLSVGRCPKCGKARYESRRAARKAGRSAFPSRHVRAYRCVGLWHFTTTPRLFPGFTSAWSTS